MKVSNRNINHKEEKIFSRPFILRLTKVGSQKKQVTKFHDFTGFQSEEVLNIKV